MTGDVADQYPFERTDRELRGSAHARAQAQENRRVTDVAHGNPDHRDVFHDSTIHGFKREAAAALEDAVSDGNVLESTVRFGAALDAAGALPVMVLRDVRRGFEAAVKQRPDLVGTGDVTIGDCDILGRACISEGKRAFQADRVVPRRVHTAVCDAYVATAIDVDSVTVGVDLEIINRQVVDPRRQNSEVSAGKHRKIAQDDVAAVLEGDRLVADAWRFLDRKIEIVMPARQPASPYESGPENGDVVDVLTPDQAVVPVVMAKILKCFPRHIGFGWIVAGYGSVARSVGCQDRGALIEVECHGAGQAKRVARVGAGRDIHRTTLAACGCDGPVDRRRIYVLAVTYRAEATNVKDS